MRTEKDLQDAMLMERDQLIVQVAEQKTELAAIKARLATAEGLLERVIRKDITADTFYDLLLDITSFLSPTPQPHDCIRCGKAKATRCTPEGICEKCWQEEFGEAKP